MSAPVRHKHMVSPPACISPKITEDLPGRAAASVYFANQFRSSEWLSGKGCPKDLTSKWTHNAFRMAWSEAGNMLGGGKTGY
jgi:hypothetical protein